MRFLLLNIFLICNFLAISQWKSFQIYQGDTINRIDQQGRKQGLWIYFNKDYKNKIVQKGYYKDNMKQGVWITYYSNGQIKSKITFKNNRQYGPAVLYYPNGKVKEQGHWKGNKWIGEYKYFYQNGKLKYQWYYNEQGKRQGIQKYFYPNGKPMLVGNWKDGKESGKLTEYYPNGAVKRISNWTEGALNGQVLEYYADGRLKAQKFYINGQEDTSRTVIYTYVKADTVKPARADTTEEQVYRIFTGTGNFKIYNKQGKITSEGYFKDGVLVDGKRYYYNQQGELTRIVIIKNGRIVDIINKKSQ